MTEPKSKEIDVDIIFDEIGHFGRYQIINYVWLCIAITVYAAITLAYVFTAGNIDYR